MSQEYKISLSQVCKDNGIVLATYKDAQKMIDLFGLNDMTRNAGFAFDTGHKKYILFDDGRSELEKRFTVAHELGHHLLGHFGYRREEDERYPQYMEVEANLFASTIVVNEILSKYAIDNQGREQPRISSQKGGKCECMIKQSRTGCTAADRATAIMWLNDVFFQVSQEEWLGAVACNIGFMEAIREVIQENESVWCNESRTAADLYRDALFVYAYNCGVAAATGENM